MVRVSLEQTDYRVAVLELRSLEGVRVRVRVRVRVSVRVRVLELRRLEGEEEGARTPREADRDDHGRSPQHAPHKG